MIDPREIMRLCNESQDGQLASATLALLGEYLSMLAHREHERQEKAELWHENALLHEQLAKTANDAIVYRALVEKLEGQLATKALPPAMDHKPGDPPPDESY